MNCTIGFKLIIIGVTLPYLLIFLQWPGLYLDGKRIVLRCEKPFFATISRDLEGY